ncbi:hypothetical protein JL100_029730 [Skermanella mucosa]|uniref:hypothetical protein n=1 Tax=Skermanella mucosa TaxID=1789672 RepID=UPI00192C6CA5|nr:hypothetical protein [Skermanella mucosa]UEM21193.1 hypothetical protein JL100_029730 [Skermanella mucosa]
MSGRKSFAGLRSKMSPRSKARIEDRKNLLRNEMALHELRESRCLTQAALGETSKVDQSAVAQFPEGDVVIRNFAEVEGRSAD